MLKAPIHLAHLARAGLVLARAGAPELLGASAVLPAPARRLAARLQSVRDPDIESLSAALADLGPSYVKLGQFLATRPDIVGAKAAGGLARLHDRLEPFADAEAEAQIVQAFGQRVGDVYAWFGPPIAAASIAQVHEASVIDDAGERAVAVKILRPGIEQRFARDLADFYFAARTAERVLPATRRLRPIDTVATLERSVELEMDLRLEAAAMSEMAELMAPSADFRVPKVDWARTSRRVMTSEWIDGITLGDPARLAAAGHDLPRLGRIVLQSFLTQALDHGFFHADMHPGNLFADTEGRLVPVDYGIMGRLGFKERRFLAEILWGFISRDYRRTAEIHFEAGYVPPRHGVADFAQALRAIGEPLAGRDAAGISMARLLTQLFEVTGQFDMQTRPELLLLQKTMVVAEGVARILDPGINLWTTAEPVVGKWLEQKMSPEGRLQEAAVGAVSLGRVIAGLPEFLERVERATVTQGAIPGGGEGAGTPKGGGVPRAAAWIGAISLVLIALAQIL